METPLNEQERQQMQAGLEAIRNINRLDHHVRYCRQCQDWLIDTIANDGDMTAAAMWTHLQAHATIMNQLGLL